MHAAFEASHKFDYDALRTAEEIERCGSELLFWLEAVAAGAALRLPDVYLIREIHRRWFETTFPEDAGRERTEVVLNRKGTAVVVDAILPGVESACGNWQYRRERFTPCDGTEFIKFVIAEVNTLTVAVYDVHPFIDGNTQTTWHLRNYVLMLDGLRPLGDLVDEKAHDDAWWAATPQDHERLDQVVLDELAAHER